MGSDVCAAMRRAFCVGPKQKEMRRAFRVCLAMLRQALKPAMVSYSSLISACKQGEVLRWAFNVAEVGLQSQAAQ